MPIDAKAGQGALQMCACFMRQKTFQRPLSDANHAHLVSADGKIVGEFTPDQPIADDGHTRGAVQLAAQGAIVVQVVDTQQRVATPVDFQSNRARTECENELRVRQTTHAGAQDMRRSVNLLNVAVRVDAYRQASLDLERRFGDQAVCATTR
ncbi:hypothetical protein D9M72_330220 [compost metagenome]